MNQRADGRLQEQAVNREKVAKLAVAGVFTALIFLFTMYIQVQIIPARGGLVHLGNVPLFFVAAFWGKRMGAACGALGMALSDLVTSWVIYAPITFIVVGLMGFVFGWIVNKNPSLPRLLAAVAAALGIKLAGYYIGEVILYHSLLVPLASLPGNAIQVITGGIVAIPVILAVKATMKQIMK